MKIRLEKPAVNISNPTGGKNEKTRRRTLHEKLWLDFYFFYREQCMEIKITEYTEITEGFLIEILLHIYNAQQIK